MYGMNRANKKADKVFTFLVSEPKLEIKRSDQIYSKCELDNNIMEHENRIIKQK